mmetsp:Transcript_31843/g.91373  ORF Transcript_31843/g.91373 Transcript_31843/m.91373 type:complete len:222 (-) Transcript_31843:1239-1904(-)
MHWRFHGGSRALSSGAQRRRSCALRQLQKTCRRSPQLLLACGRSERAGVTPTPPSTKTAASTEAEGSGGSPKGPSRRSGGMLLAPPLQAWKSEAVKPPATRTKSCTWPSSMSGTSVNGCATVDNAGTRKSAHWPAANRKPGTRKRICTCWPSPSDKAVTSTTWTRLERSRTQMRCTTYAARITVLRIATRTSAGGCSRRESASSTARRRDACPSTCANVRR